MTQARTRFLSRTQSRIKQIKVIEEIRIQFPDDYRRGKPTRQRGRRNRTLGHGRRSRRQYRRDPRSLYNESET